MSIHIQTQKHLSWLTLFTTTGTLVCCALPIMLVSLGMGATIASLVSSFPILIVFSENKTWVFAISGLLLLLSAWFIYRPGRSCPVDPQVGELCKKSLRLNQRIFWLSIVIWSIGFFAAYMALPIKIWIDQL
jgi:hypothetical protein